MDELVNDSERASVKPLLMVAALFVAAGIGAVATVRPVPATPARRAPRVDLLVMEAPPLPGGQLGPPPLRPARAAGTSLRA